MNTELKKECVLLKDEVAIFESIDKSEKEIKDGRFLTHEQLISKLNNLFK